MKYPKFLKENDVIGITALSSGCSDALDELSISLNNIKRKGYQVIVTDNVYGNYFVSSKKATRINELNELLKNELSMLLIARGGDLLYETLDDIPYEEIVKKNIWVMGYSDPTSLLFILTTKYDLATIYGFNGKSFSEETMLPYQENCFEILKGNFLLQTSFDKDNYSINGDFSSSGILIGGCLEVLKDIIGTKFDNVNHFIEKYKQDKVIWYFDIFNMSPITVYLTLLQFKNAGWFKYSDTFIIGKVLLKQSEDLMTYHEAITTSLDGNIVIDANIGHVKPVFTLINGSHTTVTFTKDKLTMQSFDKLG